MLPQQEREEKKEVETLLDKSSLVSILLRLLRLEQRLQVVVVETERKIIQSFNLINIISALSSEYRRES